MLKLLTLFSVLAVAVSAQIQSPSYQFNVTSPTPNSPYVASQILPCIYTTASNTTADNLQLSISLVGFNTSTTLVANADITQGFSKQQNNGGAAVYEQQFNYNIPVNTTAGAYQVVFSDNVSQTNVSIPITIAAAPVTPVVSSASSGSTTAAPTSTVPAGVINKTNSASAGIEISKLLLVGSFIFAFVHF